MVRVRALHYLRLIHSNEPPGAKKSRKKKKKKKNKSEIDAARPNSIRANLRDYNLIVEVNSEIFGLLLILHGCGMGGGGLCVTATALPH